MTRKKTTTKKKVATKPKVVAKKKTTTKKKVVAKKKTTTKKKVTSKPKVVPVIVEEVKVEPVVEVKVEKEEVFKPCGYGAFTLFSTVITDLKATSSANEKIHILKEAAVVKQFASLLLATYNPYVSYYVKNLGELDLEYFAYTENSWGSFFSKLPMLATRKVTGNAAREHAKRMIDKLPVTEKDIGLCVFNRDLTCGINAKTINKAYPGLVPVYDNMLCVAGKAEALAKITYPCYVEEKLDGMRCNAIVRRTDQVIEFRSRSGKIINVGVKLIKDLGELSTKIGFDYVLDGELLVLDDTGKDYLDRKTSNGIVNKAIKGTITPEEQSKLSLVIWDVIPYDNFKAGSWDYTMEGRSKILDGVFSNNIPLQITRVGRMVAKNEQLALDFYNTVIEKGGEGVIFKNQSGIWKTHRSPNCVKMKVENEADLIIEDVIEGAGKFEGKLGAFVCSSSDGKLKVRVGSGFTEIQREELFTASMKGKIIAVKYNEVITKTGSDTKSLFLPIFVEVRTDKTEADKLGDLK